MTTTKKYPSRILRKLKDQYRKSGRTGKPSLGYEYNRVLGCSPVHNAKNLAGDKETVRTMVYACSIGGEIVTPIEARFYMGRSSSASVVYCSIWVHAPSGSRFGWNGIGKPENPDKWEACPSGHGSAGGGGYHKESAALDEAIRSAGFTLEGHFGGHGDGAMNAAIMAIADYMGIPINGKIIG